MWSPPNLWAFFQTKSIRRSMVQTQADQAKLSLQLAVNEPVRAALQKQIDEWQKTAHSYRSDPSTGAEQDQLAERAKHVEEARDLAMAKYHHFRAGVGRYHHRHDCADVDIGTAGARRRRNDSGRNICAARPASTWTLTRVHDVKAAKHELRNPPAPELGAPAVRPETATHPELVWGVDCKPVHIALSGGAFR
jgi:hypothetical protein